MPESKNAIPCSDALVIVHAESECMPKSALRNRRGVDDLTFDTVRRVEAYCTAGRPVFYTAYFASELPEYFGAFRSKMRFVGKPDGNGFHFLASQVELLRARIDSALKSKPTKVVEIGWGLEGACLSATIHALVCDESQAEWKHDPALRIAAMKKLPQDIASAVESGKMRLYFDQEGRIVVLKNQSIVF